MLKKHFFWMVVLAFGMVSVAASAQNRTRWEQNNGEYIVTWDFVAPYHGWEGEYTYASIPASNDPAWFVATTLEYLNYAYIPSSLCGKAECKHAGQFTYFRTLVSLPENLDITELTIYAQVVDDGLRVSIINSAYPEGQHVAYAFYGGGLAVNLKDYAVLGEANTILLTQVDDCCPHSFLYNVHVSLNGAPLPICSPNPTLTCPADITVSQTSCGQTPVPLDLPVASGFCKVAEISCNALDSYPLGTTTVTCTAFDGTSEAQCSSNITVVDDTPPEVLVADPIMLWPPNHKYASVTIEDCVEWVDDCDGTGMDSVKVVKIYSDELENAHGSGDGNTLNDIVVSAETIYLRVERQGSGNGRVYSIVLLVTDGSGNSATVTCKAYVPKNPDSPAIDDGPSSGYTIYPQKLKPKTNR